MNLFSDKSFGFPASTLGCRGLRETRRPLRQAGSRLVCLAILAALMLAPSGCGGPGEPASTATAPTIAIATASAPTIVAEPATPTVTPTPDPLEAWIALLTGDLNPADWPTGTHEDDDAAMTRRVHGTRYIWEMQTHRAARLSAALSHDPVADFSLSADVRLVEGPSVTVVGLEFRVDDAGNRYFYGLYRDSLVCLRLTDGLWRPLFALPRSEHVRLGETNRLRVVAKGSGFDFFVNDVLVTQISDDAIPRGRVGLGVEVKGPDATVVVEWNNLSLLVPPDQSATPAKGEDALAPLVAMCQAAFDAPLAEGLLSAPVVAISKAADEMGGQWQRFDPLPYLGPVDGAPARSLVCVQERLEQVATYTDGAGAFVISWDARMVDLDSGSARASGQFSGPPPPQSKDLDGKPHISFPAATEFQAWIREQTRDRSIDAGGFVQGIAYAPDGGELAVASFGSTIDVWDLRTGQRVDMYQSQASPLVDVAFSPDGSLLAGVSRGSGVTIWETSSRRELWSQASAGVAVAFSPDGRLLATGGGVAPRIWDARGGDLLHELAGHGGPVTDVAFSRDGRLLASSSVDGTVRLWDTVTGAPAGVLRGEADTVVRCVTFSRNGALLAAGNGDHTISMWDLARQSSLPTLEGHEDSVVDLAFSRSDAVIASAGGDGLVRLWSVFAGKDLRALAGHHGGVQTLDFAPDGAVLASGSTDKTVRFWDLDP